MLLVISAMLNETGPFDPHAVTLKAFGGWLYLTVMGTTVTFAAYTWLLRRVPTKLVATYAFVNPVVAVVLGWAILGERLAGSVLLGAVLVIGSVIGVLLTSDSNNADPTSSNAAGEEQWRSLDEKRRWGSTYGHSAGAGKHNVRREVAALAHRLEGR